MIEACYLASYIGSRVVVLGSIAAGAALMAYEIVRLWHEKRRPRCGVCRGTNMQLGADHGGWQWVRCLTCHPRVDMRRP